MRTLRVTHQKETDYSWDLVESGGLCIATCGKCQSPDSEIAANAERIAMCWNEHDALREFAEMVARSACLEQINGDKCICFSCEAKRILGQSDAESGDAFLVTIIKS